MIKRYLLKSSISTIIVIVSACFIAFTNLAMAQQSNSNSRGAMSAILQLLLEENTQSQCIVTESTTINGNILVQSQSDLDELRGVSKIDGRLEIIGASLTEPLDYSALDSLVEVSSSLSFFFFNVQDKITGFSCLKEVGGRFNFDGDGDAGNPANTSLTEISGFENLQTIGTNLSISSFDNLEIIPSFDNLEMAVDRLSFFNLAKLQTLPEFNQLTSVNRLFIAENDLLTQITGFDNLTATPTTTVDNNPDFCLLYTSPSPRDKRQSRMPSSA